VSLFSKTSPPAITAINKPLKEGRPCTHLLSIGIGMMLDSTERVMKNQRMPKPARRER
jgi:hypothetical protein